MDQFETSKYYIYLALKFGTNDALFLPSIVSLYTSYANQFKSYGIISSTLNLSNKYMYIMWCFDGYNDNKASRHLNTGYVLRIAGIAMGFWL